MTVPPSVGITGHQARPGIDWPWVSNEIRELLRQAAPVALGYTSLAVGADQVFAQEALRLGIRLRAVIPLAEYERYFDADGLRAYEELLSRCDIVQLSGAHSDEEAFFEAGKYICDNCQVLLAVWDGQEAKGLGGTADVVRYALRGGISVVHLHPFERTVSFLPHAEDARSTLRIRS